MAAENQSPATSREKRIAAVRRRVHELEHLMTSRPAAGESLELLRELRGALEELLEADAALGDSVARTRAIVETAVDGIITIDEHGVIQSFNPAAERLFGYPAAEVIGQNVRILMPAPDRDRHDDYIARYLDTGQKRIIGIGREVVGQRKDGSLVPIDLAVAESPLGSGRVFTGMVRDITARKRSELRFATQYAITHALASAASLTEATPRVLQAICEGFNWNLGELWDVDPEIRRLRWNGMWHATSFEPAGFADASRDMVLAVADGLPGRAWATARAEWVVNIQEDADFRRTSIAARLGLHSAFAFPLQAGGRVIGVMAFFSRQPREPELDILAMLEALGHQIGDFIARKRAETQLRELQKFAQQRERLADIGAITAKLAHDLGNPLAGISMQAQLILRRANRDPDQPLSGVSKAAEQIVSQVGRLDVLTKDLMSFAQEQRLDLKTLDPTRFFQELVDFWRPVAAERGIAIGLELATLVSEISVDEDKLRRVFDNLVKNAVEAIDLSSGEIRIRVVPDSEKLRASVADTGSGIPESVEIFRLFETTKAHGTGLGLAIAKQIVTAHGGQIHCAPLQPRGTVFTVELPLKGPQM